MPFPLQAVAELPQFMRDAATVDLMEEDAR
jgi:hypothetical protein